MKKSASAFREPDRTELKCDLTGEIKRWYATLRALPAWQKTLARSALPAATAA